MKPEEIEAKRLLHIICDKFKVDIEKLKAKDRHSKYVYPRQLYAYIAKDIEKLTYSQIAKSINRNHSTVVIAREKIKHEIKYYPKVSQHVKEIKKLLFKIDFIVQDVNLLALCN